MDDDEFIQKATLFPKYSFLGNYENLMPIEITFSEKEFNALLDRIWNRKR